MSNLQNNDICAALPCPFCGASDVAVVEGDTFRWRLVLCNCCGAQGPDVRIQTAGSGTNAEWEQRAKAGAVAEWNKRPTHNAALTRGAKEGEEADHVDTSR